MRAATWLLALLFLAVLAAACGSGPEDDDAPAAPTPTTTAERTGPARSYGMGFLALPAELSEGSYVELFDLAAERGDLVMIQRSPPWPELLETGQPGPADLAAMEREAELARARGLDVLFAIDPWEPIERGRLAGLTAASGFDDPAVTDAYLAYVELVLERYQPRWIVLGVDVDQFAAARPAQLDAFEAAYVAAYQLVKERRPQTLAFLTFQLEDLQALVPWGASHDPQWGLVLRFAPMVDVLAVSSFPSFIFPFERDVPAEYFTRLTAFGRPVAVVPAGYSSEPGRNGVTFGDAAGQRDFLARLLEEADAGDWELVVWLAPRDPRFAVDPPYDLVAHMGLREADGDPKAAWAVWANTASRPWAPLEREPAGFETDAVSAEPPG